MDSSRSTPSATPPDSPRAAYSSLRGFTAIHGPQTHRHRRPRSKAARPKYHHAQESYMASASGSQSEDFDENSNDTSSDDDDNNNNNNRDQDSTSGGSSSVRRDDSTGTAPFASTSTATFHSMNQHEVESDSTVKRTRRPSPTSSVTDLHPAIGRGEYVLVERRPLVNMNGSTGNNQVKSAWTSWLPSRLTARRIEGKRRTASPSVSRSRANAGNGSTKSGRITSPEPSPPLTIDSIQPTYNPFALFPIRTELVAETILLTGALALALYRLSSMSENAIFREVPNLPIKWLSAGTAAVPFITLLRRRTHYFKAPFTDERGYRDASMADDGVAAALVLPILMATSCLWDTYSTHARGVPASIGLEGVGPIVAVWEASGVHALSKRQPFFNHKQLLSPLSNVRTLLRARSELVLLNSLNAVVFVIHLVLSETVFKVDKLPKSNTKRFFGSMGVANAISTAIYFTLLAWHFASHNGLLISPFEAATTTLIQQTSLYIVSRLARRGFTLGEMYTMAAAGNALCLEFWRLTTARWWYKRGYPRVPSTFRLPTPVVAFQSVLIPGAFLSGFLLSPLLVVSRHIASKPSHRLRWPTERERHRRLLAAGVFLGLFGIAFFMLGGWAGWQLGRGLRRPWLWALQLTFYGGDGVVVKLPGAKGWQRWKRIWLVTYWAATIVLAIAGWQTRLVRARRIRIKNSLTNTTSGTAEEKKKLSGQPEFTGPKYGVEHAREEKRVHASLNMRRKFFHALAVAMFVPGIAVDPAFTSLAFSVAFAVFTFAEYARYFALYPIGGPLHVFFSEFIDSKDSGPVILSHFYLLTGCAGGVWLEGQGINRFTGVLVLGIGDAMASIVGKHLGRLHWPGSPKTVEGTMAFVVSIVSCAWLFRLTGLAESFSMWRYVVATTLSALLEASSNQNDNLVIPIYMWSMVTLLKC
ncbi:dolichol kinase [Microbotryomycetes sp. JL221]|nr:dolichol kinase [Microbotryomycetes sp. JL221]